MAERSQACHDLLDQLSDYLDKDASEVVCKAIEEHMAGCDDCTAMINTLRKTIDLYSAQSSEGVLPAEVRLRLFRRLELEDLMNAGADSD
jgi:predicted anti-sigma-YlaC factor YlaD